MKVLVPAFIVWFLASQPALASRPHFVFAHYMVCYATYGQSLDGYKREIQAAQTAGIDGFALNVGSWNGPDAYYKQRVELIYQAAESLDTDFKLFFSVDMANTNDILQMVGAYAKRTNSFRYNGRLVVSSFGGNGLDWTNGVLQPLQNQGINVFFIPYFITEGATWQTLGAGASALLVKYGGFVDGLFQFAAGLPGDITNMDSAYGKACQSAGKLFMAGCSPNYWGFNQPYAGRPYFESQGGEGMITQWNWIIQNQPDWVEIVTWNDLNESTYITPLPKPDQFNPSPQQRYSHAGYLELSKRYISWYKTGQDPAINDDGLFFFYRTHARDAVARNTNDVPVSVFLGDVQDVIYITMCLTAPATLKVDSGASHTTRSLPAGITNLRFPFSPGAQTFSLQRDGLPPLTVQGPDILSRIDYYNFFPASGYVRSPPVPPQNLRVLKKNAAQ